MIATISGIINNKSTDSVVVQVNGIGFLLSISFTTFKTLPEIGEQIFLYSYLHVRENALTLYGFATEGEKELFQDLLSVSGIGPKLALTMLSGISVADLYNKIAQADEAALVRVPGLGKKTAQRLVMDLREKALKHSQQSEATQIKHAHQDTEQAIAALVSLGYSRSESQSAVDKAVAESSANCSLQELIQRALQF